MLKFNYARQEPLSIYLSAGGWGTARKRHYNKCVLILRAQIWVLLNLKCQTVDQSQWVCLMWSISMSIYVKSHIFLTGNLILVPYLTTSTSKKHSPTSTHTHTHTLSETVALWHLSYQVNKSVPIYKIGQRAFAANPSATLSAEEKLWVQPYFPSCIKGIIKKLRY